MSRGVLGEQGVVVLILAVVGAFDELISVDNMEPVVAEEAEYDVEKRLLEEDFDRVDLEDAVKLGRVRFLPGGAGWRRKVGFGASSTGDASCGLTFSKFMEAFRGFICTGSGYVRIALERRRVEECRLG